MATTFIKIASVTVGSGGTGAIDFTSIPQTYTDLCLKYSLRSTANDVAGSTPIDVRLTFNGLSSGYSERMIYSTGSSASSAATTGSYANWAGTQTNNSQTSSTFANNEMYIPNYAGSSNKSVSVDGVQENNASASAARLTAILWSNAAAINQVTLAPDYGNFAQYSTATLYGIKNS